MHCKCNIIETQNNVWVLNFSECIEGHMTFGPFSSSDEARYYCKNFFGEFYFQTANIIDFEHPQAQNLRVTIKGPPYKHRYWDFEDFKVMAWREAGFRSRR